MANDYGRANLNKHKEKWARKTNKQTANQMGAGKT